MVFLFRKSMLFTLISHGKVSTIKQKKSPQLNHLNSLKMRVTGIFFILVLVPMLLISVVTSFFYNQSMTNQASEMVDNSAVQNVQIINERLDIYRNKLYEALTDRNIIALAKKLNEASSTLDTAYQKQILNSALSNYVSAKGYGESLIFISDTDYAIYDKTALGGGSVWDSPAYREIFLNLSKNHRQITYISGMNPSSASGSEDSGTVYMAYPLCDLETRKYEGILVMGLSNEIFQYHYEEEAGSQNQIRTMNGIRFATISSVNRIISNYDIQDPLYRQLNTYLSGDEKSSGFDILHKPIKDTPWSLVCIMDRSILLREVNRLKQVMITLTAVVCVAFLLILLYIVRRLDTSVRKVAAGIKTYEPGEDHTNVELGKTDALYAIVRQFNGLIQRNNQLIETLKDKNEEIQIETEQRKKAELKALEAQINPHFLYNVLDSINWIAIDNEEMEISRMLTSLGSILRYSVTNIDTVVLLEAEIEWMKKYIFLQQERLGKVFTCNFDVPENTLAFPIYKMLLQPLVENAIMHGFEGAAKNGIISLRTRRKEQNMLEIRISDNGCGMNEEAVREIRKKIDGEISKGGNSIGISNVINRIHLYYKSQAKITVNSRLGEGTEFVLLLPDEGGSY